jgi:hypothetical protein
MSRGGMGAKTSVGHHYVRNSNRRHIEDVPEGDRLQSGKMRHTRITKAHTWLRGG